MSEASENQERLNKKEKVFAIVLIVFLAIAIIQAIQLNSLKETIKIEQGQVMELQNSINSVSFSASSSLESNPTTQTGIPSNLQNLPDMVGGC